MIPVIPEEFIKYAFEERVAGIRKLAERKFDPSVLLGFTRHNPAIITCGGAGPNGSIKGIGFIHEEEYLEETLQKLREELKRPYNPREALNFLLNEIYVREKIDFTKLVSLELAKKHTWANVTGGSREATVLFFTPPSTSYEVRCEVEVHEGDEVWEYTNAVHDVFHRPKKPRNWSRTPAYLFKIKEIYDNGERAMGVRIYP
ncbi:hypothetical protein [Thermococcus peptonophilus]|uniref:hypothetical protein n=1 Tax=Thermococcus peptonophilus TaxID=53952 RepID=UPI000A6047FA|nr:hypothetical protein [Thermococcus peptonophilus]